MRYWKTLKLPAVVLLAGLLFTPGRPAQATDPAGSSECVKACQEGSVTVCTILGECKPDDPNAPECRQCVAMFLGGCISACTRQFGP